VTQKVETEGFCESEASLEKISELVS
jgi:hypothetical protein